MAELLESLAVFEAERNETVISGVGNDSAAADEYIQGYIWQNDIVIGLWPDKSQSSGYNWAPVKNAKLCAAVLLAGTLENVSLSAIFVRDADHAKELLSRSKITEH